MTTPQQYALSAIDLSGSQFTVEQTGRDGNFRPEYEARDVAGDTIFRTTYQMYEEKDEFPFVDADGAEICRVKAIDTWDIAGDYLLTDSHTDEDIVIFDNDLSLLEDTWRIRDADDRSLLAEISSRGALITLGRKLLPFGQGIAHKYEITLTDTSSIPTEAIVVGTIVIDAIQAN